MPIRPMLATLEEAPLVDESLVYEPKYDGIRAVVEINPSGSNPVRIWSRLGNEKTAQFPDLVAALARYAKKLKGPVVLIAFDALKDRDEDLRPLPLTARRARLERIFRNPGSPILRISEAVPA